MCTQNELSAITSGIVRSYQETYREDLRQIYLYGSYARGDYDSESDIDLVAVVDGDRADLQQKLRKVWDVATELGLEYDIVVSPTVIPKNEFDRFAEALPYYRNIRAEGVLLYA